MNNTSSDDNRNNSTKHTEQPTCSKCGSEVEEKDNYCWYCGNQLKLNIGCVLGSQWYVRSCRIVR
jgi:predicted amidophosphoribosyltransferase